MGLCKTCKARCRMYCAILLSRQHTVVCARVCRASTCNCCVCNGTHLAHAMVVRVCSYPGRTGVDVMLCTAIHTLAAGASIPWSQGATWYSLMHMYVCV